MESTLSNTNDVGNGCCFSKMFRFSVPGVNYFVYFEVGFIMFNYFSEATNNGMTSVVFNFNLLTKVYIPKYIFPLSKCLFCGINFILTLIPLFFVIIFTGTIKEISWFYLLLPLIFLFGFLFTVGISFILATVSVFSVICFIFIVFYLLYGIMLHLYFMIFQLYQLLYREYLDLILCTYI